MTLELGLTEGGIRGFTINLSETSSDVTLHTFSPILGNRVESEAVL